MAGSPLQDAPGPTGHGPSSFGGAGAQFLPHFGDVQDDFSKLHIDDKKEKDGGVQRPKSTRRVSFNTAKGAPLRYEYYSFTKRDDWTVADRIKLPAPQEELEKTVFKGKKGSKVLESLKKMSAERQAQIERLLEEKNSKEPEDVQWHCVFIDSPSPQDKAVGGKRIREHMKMDVIVAQYVLAGRPKSTAREKSKSFVGEKSDIYEPIKPKDKVNGEDKPSKSDKDGKDDNSHRDDLFATNSLFTTTGVAMNNHGPIPGYPPHHQPFNQEMGRQFDSLGAQPTEAFQPMPLGGNPPSAGPFPQPQPGQRFHNGIQIVDDPLPLPGGANNVFPGQEHLPPSGGRMHPPDQHPHFQQPRINEINGHQTPFKKQDTQPIIVQYPSEGHRYNNQRWVHDDSSRESEDDHPLSDEDERSSHTSYDDYYEILTPHGSLFPHRHSSTRKREPTYREHRRRPSYPIEPQRRIERPPPPDRRYHSDRRPRQHSRDRRESIKYIQAPQRLERYPASPPLTPISNSSYSSSRRFSGLPSPHELEREKEYERLAEDYMRDKHLRDREEAVHRRERDLDDRDFWDRSRLLERIGRRVSGSGHDRYLSGR